MLLLSLLPTVGATVQTDTSSDWAGLGSWTALKAAVEGASGGIPLTITVRHVHVIDTRCAKERNRPLTHLRRGYPLL